MMGYSIGRDTVLVVLYGGAFWTTCIPLDRTFLPFDRTFIPLDRTFLPFDRTSIPFDRTFHPFDRTFIPLDRAFLPLDRTSIILLLAILHLFIPLWYFTFNRTSVETAFHRIVTIVRP